MLYELSPKRELVSLLFSRNVAVYLVSGGFSQLIEPVAEELGIPKENIYANQILFNEKGEVERMKGH